MVITNNNINGYILYDKNNSLYLDASGAHYKQWELAEEGIVVFKTLVDAQHDQKIEKDVASMDYEICEIKLDLYIKSLGEVK